jgi:hypothetical protein
VSLLPHSVPRNIAEETLAKESREQWQYLSWVISPLWLSWIKWESYLESRQCLGSLEGLPSRTLLISSTLGWCWEKGYHRLGTFLMYLKSCLAGHVACPGLHRQEDLVQVVPPCCDNLPQKGPEHG